MIFNDRPSENSVRLFALYSICEKYLLNADSVVLFRYTKISAERKPR